MEVDPADTTKECNQCGVKTEKPLWVREHSCPSCGYTTDRDYNSALNVWERGLSKLGVVLSEETTPAETGTVLRTEGSDGPHENGVLVNAVETSVSASSVVETGSPCLKEAALAAE